MHPYLSLFFLVLLTACAPEPPLTELPITEAERPLSATEQAVRDSLDLIWHDYETLRLPRAFGRARRLGAFVEDRNELRGELRAEAWQALAVLHFDHMVYPDSVAHYTELAGPQVGEHSPVELRARQLLCRSITTFDTWSWLEMGLHAQLGRHLLRGAGQDSTLLYARLLLMEARGAKQVADRTKQPRRQRDFYTKSEALFEQSIALLESLDSPWAGHAIEHLIILLSRRSGQEARIRRLAATAVEWGSPRGGEDAPAYFGFRDHALSYYHHRHSRTDSARIYARRLIAHAPLFATKRVQEALYALKEISNAEHRHADAVAYLSEDMYTQGCCPPGADPATENGAFACNERPKCLYFLSALARTYQLWGEWANEGRYLDRAFRYTQGALTDYEETLRHQSEEGVLNSTIVLGDRLITSALEAAMGSIQRTPTDTDLYDALLRTMEIGKSVLYTRELLAINETLANEAADTTARQLRQVEAELKLLKAAFAGQLTLPLPSLLRYEQLSIRSKDLVRRIRRAPTHWSANNRLTTAPRLSELREELSATQSLLEYAETEDMLYALYIDRDTVIAYVQPIARIIKLADELTELLSGPPMEDRSGYDDTATSLFCDLIGPFSPFMSQRKELLLTLTPSLSAVPFAALLQPPDNGRSSTFLIDSYRIRYLDGWRSERQRRVLLDRSPKPRTPRIGAWTHPDLFAYLDPVTTALPITEGGGQHYGGEECTSKSLLSNAGQYDWLHLAVHARGNSTQLNENYLYLNDQDSLNGVHISKQILHARLVVLVACSTSRGFRNRREGTYSLRRSFHRAGVPDVVASLYNIPAAATAKVLEQFYQELLRGADPTEALTLAQRRAASGRLGQRWTWPGYWAGVLVG